VIGLAQRIRIQKEKTAPDIEIEQFKLRHGTESFVCRVLTSLIREGVIRGYVPTRRFIPRGKQTVTGFWVVRVDGSCYKARRLFFVYPEHLGRFRDNNPGEAVIAVSLGDREQELTRRMRKEINLLFDGTN
jgi:hypothetical protein